MTPGITCPLNSTSEVCVYMYSPSLGVCTHVLPLIGYVYTSAGIHVLPLTGYYPSLGMCIHVFPLIGYVYTCITPHWVCVYMYYPSLGMCKRKLVEGWVTGVGIHTVHKYMEPLIVDSRPL